MARVIVYSFIPLFCSGFSGLVTSSGAQGLNSAEPVFIIVLDGATPCVQDFEDFIAFASAFGSREGDPEYIFLADTDDSGAVDFTDFINFAGAFRRVIPSERCLPPGPRYQVVGQVTHLGRVLAGVWLEVTKTIYVGHRNIETDQEGRFTISDLSPGSYSIIPHRFGFTFTPDTLQIPISDSPITGLNIEADQAFVSVNVHVTQGSKPVEGVEVAFTRSISGKRPDIRWTGQTDASGAASIRISDGFGSNQRNLAGYYTAELTDPLTSAIVDTWRSIPINLGEKRPLVFEIGEQMYYKPEPVFFRYRNDRKMRLSPSQNQIAVRFQRDLSEESRHALLSQLGLKESGSFGHALQLLEVDHTRGQNAVLEKLHRLRLSGSVEFANPVLYEAPGSAVYLTEELIVKFEPFVTEDQITSLNEEMGTFIKSQLPLSKSYVLGVSDPLSVSSLDMANTYHDHPFVIYAELNSLRFVYYLNYRAAYEDEKACCGEDAP